MPRLKLSRTQANPNKVFLSCPKVREVKCNYFQWIHQQPKPKVIPTSTTPSVLKKRLHDMAQEHLQAKRVKVEEGGFRFP